MTLDAFDPEIDAPYPLHRRLDIGVRDLESPLASKVEALRVQERLPLAVGMRALGAVFRRVGLTEATAQVMRAHPGPAGLAHGLSRIDGPVPAAVLAAQEKRRRRAARNRQEACEHPSWYPGPAVDLCAACGKPWADIIREQILAMRRRGEKPQGMSIDWAYVQRPPASPTPTSRKKPRRERRLARRAS